MKIAIFYRDVFLPGGMAGEIMGIANALANRHEVFVWGVEGTISQAFDAKVQCKYYARIRDIRKQFSAWLRETKPDLVLLAGFFIIDNLPATRAIKQAGIPMVLYPLAQVTTPVMAGKIFTQDPDVRKLEQGGLQLPNLKEKLMIQINPMLKTAYLNSIGKFLTANSRMIAVLSEFEANHFRKYLPTYTGRFTQLRWGLDRKPEENDPRHYYREVLGFADDKANYVYWGRLDWHYKGLDRLLNGVLHCVQSCKSNDVPFRLFLIGPDYRDGAQKIRKFIEAHQLQDVVHLMLPGSYPAGSKMPLRDASASIYLSRWDGFPRTLRESTLLNVPVLVSEETHFGALVTEHVSGIALTNPDEPREVSNALMALAEPERQNQFKTGAEALAPRLSWGEAVEVWLAEYESNLSEKHCNKAVMP
jgi:glycosyltransferase involved in cell wall biosynthesis